MLFDIFFIVLCWLVCKRENNGKTVYCILHGGVAECVWFLFFSLRHICVLGWLQMQCVTVVPVSCTVYLNFSVPLIGIARVIGICFICYGAAFC